MCGRYSLIPTENFYKRFKVNNQLHLSPRYNVAPGELMPVVVRGEQNTLVIMKWGLIPFWADDPKIGFKMINARAESISEKPSFRKAFRKQRCLVPASGFFEWQKTDNQKTPFYIKLKKQPLFSFAGLFDLWKDAQGKEIRSYTIITTQPNNVLAPIHNRMPVVLEPEEEDVWLDQSMPENTLVRFLKPFDSQQMEIYPVSNEVNKPENDNENIIKPVSKKEEKQLNFA